MLTLAPLLAFDPAIAHEVRRALAERRLDEAARALMRDYALTCAETQALVGNRCPDA